MPVRPTCPTPLQLRAEVLLAAEVLDGAKSTAVDQTGACSAALQSAMGSFTSASYRRTRTAEVDATAVSKEMSQLAAVANPDAPSEVTAISLWLHAAEELWGTREPNCCRGGVLVSS